MILEDATLPDWPFETTIEYVAPFLRPTRKEGCCKGLAFFGPGERLREVTKHTMTGASIMVKPGKVLH